MLQFIDTLLYPNEDWKKYYNEPSLYKSQIETSSPIDYLRQTIMEGMKEETEEVKRICESAEAPSFENTIVALSSTGEKLERATEIMYNLLSAETSDDLDKLAEEVSPLLSEHSNNIMLNPQLFERVKAVYNSPSDGLTTEDRMLLDKTYQGFERSGATLDEDGKKRFREITSKLSDLSLKFSQNLLKETNAFVLHLTDENDLAGIPQIHRDAAKAEAKAKGLDGWVFTLQAPSYVPFITYAANRTLREKIYRAYNTRCTHGNANDNNEIVRQTVNLRAELSRLLGYTDYADYALRRRMAAKAENVYQLFDDLIEQYLPKAKAEVKEVEERARQEEGEQFALMPWDFSYYSQKLREEKYAYDPDMLRPYFELSAVKKGVFSLANRLYGINLEPKEGIETYHSDVDVYSVYDENGDLLGTLLLDFFPRDSKKGGAWMTNYRGESCMDDAPAPYTATNTWRPVVSVVTNFTKPTDTQPALLTLGEVQTFLHEFGHSLHGLFAMTRYEALSGTSVYWDFVELPSQFMENYAVEPEFLSTFAFHYQTGEPIPAEYLERIRKCRCFQSAYACMRQVSFGLLDMAFHTIHTELEGSVKEFEERAWERVRLLPMLSDTSMVVQFSHIMAGGYAAGYYSYKWAEVLDADAFSLFQEKGIFDKETAHSFRENILSKGGTRPPMELYTNFRGKSPSIDALLRRDGIK